MIISKENNMPLHQNLWVKHAPFERKFFGTQNKVTDNSVIFREMTDGLGKRYYRIRMKKVIFSFRIGKSRIHIWFWRLSNGKRNKSDRRERLCRIAA